MNIFVLGQKTLALLGLAALIGCSRAPEPGTPPQPPSGLFPGYRSYATLEDLKDQLPARSAWRVLADSKHPPRRRCPRFDELTFIVTAEHLGYPGTLQLTFINDRLKQTLFMPNDLDAYLRTLGETGLRLTPGPPRLNTTIGPSTAIWLSDPVSHRPRFVGWRDERFEDQVHEYIMTCS